MPQYNIHHITRYIYSSPVIDCTNQIMLYPIVDSLLEVRNHDIRISNDPAIETFVDYFGNHIGVFSLITPHQTMQIESIAEVVTKQIIPPRDEAGGDDQWNYIRGLKNHTGYMDFLQQEFFRARDEVKQMLQEIVTEEQTPLQNSINLSGYVYNNFKYEKGITSVETNLDDVWKMKGGVCQDFAHILVEFLRMIDIPARYVSGYICPKDKELRGEGATHAWVEVCVPYYGWLGLDPTNNCIVNDRHIRLATGRNFADCTPVKGTYKGSGEHTLSVSVEIKNGAARSNDDKPSTPKFSYHAKNPGEPINSYRYYLEVQRKQQQQQQQQQ